MILLEVHNRIIEEILTQQIETFLRKEKIVELKTDIIGEFSRFTPVRFGVCLNDLYLSFKILMALIIMLRLDARNHSLSV